MRVELFEWDGQQENWSARPKRSFEITLDQFNTVAVTNRYCDECYMFKVYDDNDKYLTVFKTVNPGLFDQ